MANETKLHEERLVLRVNGLQAYQVQVVCTDRGDLPDLGLFVYEIVDVNDAADDVFTRIAEVVDFSASAGYLNDRTAAIVAGAKFWRHSSVTKQYADVDVANSGVRAIFDRVNTLVNDYVTYKDEFVTSGVDVTFPTVDPTYVANLKAAYDAAYTLYNAVLDDQTTAQTALTDAGTSLTNAESYLAEWQDMYAREQARQAEMSAAETALGTALTTDVWYAGATNQVIVDYRASFGPETRQLIMNGSLAYTPPVMVDVGRPVVQVTSGDSGVLVGFSNSMKIWYVTPDTSSDVFAPGNAVAVTGGTGAGTPSGSAICGYGILDDSINALEAEQTDFNTLLQGTRSAKDAAAAGTAHHNTDVAFTLAKKDAKEADVATGQTNVTAAQVAYNQAQANSQTAYTTLEEAYNAVKAVCPSWTPPNPFPPVPSP